MNAIGVWLLVALSLITVVLGVVLVWKVLTFIRSIEGKIRSIEDQTHAFFEPQGESPSPFAEMVDKTAAILSARLVTSAQAALRGSAGGQAKAENAEQQLSMVQANPILGLLGGKLGKNPLATAALSFLGSRLFGGQQSTTVPSNGNTPKFKL